MTRDDIIRMAKEVGGVEHYAGLADKVCWAFEESELEAFAALVAAAEREACIKACDSVDLVGADDCIFAIRERGAP
jgi:hypothetical protein